MAQKVEVTLIDDLDGGKADETITFGLSGTQYEIDLSEANAGKLRQGLAKYIEAARKESTSRQGLHRGARKVTAADGPNTSDVREWAKAEGYEISERGRVAKDLIIKFQEAHG
jgi:hypothetical protein